MSLTVFEEAAHACEFIISEANGLRSRENGTLVSGQNLRAGTVVMDNGSGKLTRYLAGLPTDGGLSEAAGILLYDSDASAGDLPVSYLARHAEVNIKLLTFPESTDDGENTGEASNTAASLGYLGIICRGDVGV